MRELPDNASVDHLRQQAKDLLHVLRRSDAGMTLSAAQAELALQHGFECWADLKSEVERRRAEPPVVGPTELAAAIAEAFDLGTVCAPLVHVDRHWGGEGWDLRTTSGRWVVTELPGYMDAPQVDVESAFVRKAIAAGVIAPVPIAAADGTHTATFEGQRWRVHQWMPLGAMPTQPPPEALAAEGGRILAVLHQLREPANGPVVPWLTYRCGEQGWQQTLDLARAQGKVWADDLARAIPGFLALDEVLDRADPNPRAILSKAWHAPTGCRDVGAGRLAAIGWEHTSPVPPDWDLGGSLLAWSESVVGQYQLAAGRAFLDGYTAVVGPVDLTIEMFSAGVTAGLNWTISRANYALCPDDPVAQERCERNIRVLLKHPLSPTALHRLVAVLTT